MSDEVSLGEVYRLCQRIEHKVDQTNGRVTKLETDNVRIKAYWTAGAVIVGFTGDWIKHRLGL
jgi:hypothetical protein